MENLLQSAAPLGLIAVAADRFFFINESVCLRKLQRRRLLVLISVIWSANVDLRGILSFGDYLCLWR